MTFTGKIRLSLILIAVVPPLLITSVIYFHSVKQLDLFERQQASATLRKFHAFHDSFQKELRQSVNDMARSAELKKNLFLLSTGALKSLTVNPHSYRLDFLEILDSTLTVLATYHRPGLVGEPIQPDAADLRLDSAGQVETIEYDTAGAHPAIAFLKRLEPNRLLYTGCYLDGDYLARMRTVLDAEVEVFISPDTLSVLAGMEKGMLYAMGKNYRAILEGGKSAPFAVVATFTSSYEKPVMLSLLRLTGLVALFSMLAALGLGLYITNHAKREIDNLVQATARVAAGDFSSPVMAYEEGEFSQLADSFSEMTVKLKKLQQQLATTAKIAAWQAVGRKIAHEIKNPLTPIAISVEDLRRSYVEGLPDFDKTFQETTATIKSEVNRLSKLLDSFVGFARMSPPDIRTVKGKALTAPLETLYRAELDSGRLVLRNHIAKENIRLDPEAFTQVLINLIKNGLEAAPKATVTLTLQRGAQHLLFTVEDTGPGFSEEKLRNSFEPYVTTKEGGSGLGLVICHRIVHDHGGTMELYNRQQGGGGVRITLPQ